MNYKNIFLGIISLILIFNFSCKQKSEIDKADNSNQKTNDSIIRDIKFSIYCFYAKSKFSFINDKKKRINYRECDLNIGIYEKGEDTLSVAFSFYYKGREVFHDSIINKDNYLFPMILYSQKQHRIVSYLYNTNISTFSKGANDPMFNSKQPELINFLKSNIDNVSPFLKNELKRRKFL